MRGFVMSVSCPGVIVLRVKIRSLLRGGICPFLYLGLRYMYNTHSLTPSLKIFPENFYKDRVIGEWYTWSDRLCDFIKWSDGRTFNSIISLLGRDRVSKGDLLLDGIPL